MTSRAWRVLGAGAALAAAAAALTALGTGMVGASSSTVHLEKAVVAFGTTQFTSQATCGTSSTTTSATMAFTGPASAMTNTAARTATCTTTGQSTGPHLDVAAGGLSVDTTTHTMTLVAGKVSVVITVGSTTCTITVANDIQLAGNTASSHFSVSDLATTGEFTVSPQSTDCTLSKDELDSSGYDFSSSFTFTPGV